MTYQIQKLLSRVFAGSNALIITEFEPDMKISTLRAMFNQQYATIIRWGSTLLFIFNHL